MNTLTTDQYHAGTAARAEAVAAALTDEGWTNVTTSGPLVLFPTAATNRVAIHRVAACCADFDIRGVAL
jgi:hypothetical protein